VRLTDDSFLTWLHNLGLPAGQLYGWPDFVVDWGSGSACVAVPTANATMRTISRADYRKFLYARAKSLQLERLFDSLYWSTGRTGRACRRVLGDIKSLPAFA